MQNLVGRDGDVFADTHTIREKLGDGGTAQVWAALHEPTGEVVACKMASKQPGMRWSRAVRTFANDASLPGSRRNDDRNASAAAAKCPR